MKEATEKLLKLAGFGSDVIDALKADELPENFDIDSAVSSYKAKRKELILNDSDLMKELKQKHNSEQFPAIIKPLLKVVRDSAGFTAEELDALKEEGQKYPDMKRAINAMAEKLRKSGNKSQEEAMQKYFDVQKEYESFKETSKTQIEQIKAGHINELKQRDIKQQFSKMINGMDLVIPHEGANLMLYSDISNNYKLDIDEKGQAVILNHDGSKVANDNDFLSLQDVLKMKAETFNIIKKSNGGGGEGNKPDAPNHPPNYNRNTGKLSGRAAEMEKRAAEKNNK